VSKYEDLDSKCQKELGRAYHMAFFVWQPQAILTSDCDQDIKVCLCHASLKKNVCTHACLILLHTLHGLMCLYVCVRVCVSSFQSVTRTSRCVLHLFQKWLPASWPCRPHHAALCVCVFVCFCVMCVRLCVYVYVCVRCPEKSTSQVKALSQWHT